MANSESASSSVGVRLQQLGLPEQALVLARLVESRGDSRVIRPSQIEAEFYELGLPAPARIATPVASLVRRGYLAHGQAHGEYRITPAGRAHAVATMTDIDLASLVAEVAAEGGSRLGEIDHAVVPPSLAPPALIAPVAAFLKEHPFERNVFGMTRFPDEDLADPDPVGAALDVARTVCAEHGLEFHLASDRAMHDDLWGNVSAHMWASRYGIGFFEDQRGRGVNYNLTIEVGSMLMAGRRCALLKDSSIPSLPTDFVGMIYKPVDLTDPASVASALHKWIREDLGLGACPNCP